MNKNMFLLCLLLSMSLSSASLLYGQQSTGRQIPEGAVSGLFSVSNTKKVYFSKGNLQYQASTKTWRFAEKQWDFCGENNSHASQSYNGWIDLFGWGTSGYPNGAVCYQPWSTSENVNDYCVNGLVYSDLTGKADWGYNAISNGGNAENQWRTLTKNEWLYLLNRKTPSGISWTYALVNKVFGLIILPDDWSKKNCFLQTEGKMPMNKITEEEWMEFLEPHGAVFLPITGLRDGNRAYSFSNPKIDWGFFSDHIHGAYWSSSYLRQGDGSQYNRPTDVYSLYFSEEGGMHFTSIGITRATGRSVRLVRDVQ